MRKRELLFWITIYKNKVEQIPFRTLKEVRYGSNEKKIKFLKTENQNLWYFEFEKFVKMTEKISSQYHKAPSKMYRRGFTGYNLTMPGKLARICLVWSDPKIHGPICRTNLGPDCSFMTFRPQITWGASSRWSPSLYFSMRNSDQMATGKTQPTLVFLIEIPKFLKNQRRRLKRSLSWTAQNEYQINQVSKEIQKTSGKKRSSIIWVWTYATHAKMTSG